MSTVTLIFGVSGVGKTRACADYVARHPNYLFVSASHLLKAAKKATAEELRTAPQEEIVNNQALLAGALDQYRAGRADRPILVEGHAIIDNDHSLVAVPASAVAALNPDKLILLEATPVDIAARRASDARFRPIRTLDAIKLELASEREAVEYFGLQLGLIVESATVGPSFSLDSILDPSSLDQTSHKRSL